MVIGACLAPQVRLANLAATLLAFFGAVGLAAHALDELNGRPLGTGIPSRALIVVAVCGLSLAIGLGTAGIFRVGGWLLPFMVVGPVLVVAYNLELGGGVLHNDVGFGAAWGAFPALVGYVGQTGSLSWAAVVAAGGAMAMSMAQRSLSTPARRLRRRARNVEGEILFSDGSAQPLDQAALLAPLERALKAASWGVVLMAASFAISRLT